MSYGGLINSSVWLRAVVISYVGLNISSVWHSNNMSLSHTDDLLTPPYDITTAVNSYGRLNISSVQATGLDAWASRVKCPARFVSHLHEIYIWVVYSLCFFCCLFITVTWWYVWCFEWASGNQEEVQAWLFIISCYSLYKTTLGFMLMIWK